MLQQYAVNSLEYQKGRALHQRGQAALSSAEEAHGRTQIQATVRDLSRRYDVEVTIQSTGLAADGNWGDFDIEESSCSCGEYHTPGKLCRHEIAAVLQYFCEACIKCSYLSCLHKYDSGIREALYAAVSKIQYFRCKSSTKVCDRGKENRAGIFCRNTSSLSYSRSDCL